MSIKPGFSLAANKETVILGAMAAGLILFFYFQAKAAVKTVTDTAGNVVSTVVNAVNPASTSNVVQSVGNAVVKLVSEKAARQDTGLSTWITDRFWVNDYDPNKD